VLLAFLAAGFLCLGAIEAWGDAPTFDEPVYVSSGLAAILHGNLALNDEHPPLAKVLAALPVLFADPVMPAGGASSTDEHAYSAAFVRAQLAAGKLRAVDFASRIVPLLECIVIALLLYGLAVDLFGGDAGLLCAGLWLASPLVLGLGHLDGVDLPFSLAVVACSWTLLRWMRSPRRRRLVALGIAGGIVALTNASGLLIVAVCALLVPALELGRRPATGDAQATRLGNAHATRPSSRGRPDRSSARRAAIAGLTYALSALGVIWLTYIALDPAVLHAGLGLLPRPYLDGLRYLAHNDSAPAPSYLDGVAWTGGRWWYWPLSLAIKLPPATLAVLVLGPLGLLAVDRGGRREAVLVTALPATVLFAFDLTLRRDIGVRYLLPVIALWLVAASAGAGAGGSRGAGGSAGGSAVAGAGARASASATHSMLIRTALAASVLLGILATADSFPYSLSWTSPLFGASYRVATNSSVDWGQDFFRLQSWDRDHVARVAYFGPRGLTLAERGHARPLLGVPPARITGWVAVSATDLTTLADLSWLRAYCPVQRIGGTILVYRFAHPPSAEPGPSEPASLCRASGSHRA
jgi:hypothetical protein